MAKLGLISNGVDELIVKKMGVNNKNMFSLQNSRELAQRLQRGDTLCVASVGSVNKSVNGLWNTFNDLSNSGVDFASCDEKRLNFSVDKPLPSTVRQTITIMSQAENEILALLSYCRMDSGHRVQAGIRIQAELLRILTHIFNNETVHKFRGS